MESHRIDEVAGLVGREVLDLNETSIGYVDLVFVEHETGRPEWIGVWSGTPGRPRVLVPLRGVEAGGNEIRAPWTEDVMHEAPTYGEEDDRGHVAGESGGISLSPDKERSAYLHYGLEPPDVSGEGVIRAANVPRS
jgi:hypothetical protein